MLLIYTHRLTARLQYIFELLINHLVGTSYQLTEDREAFRTYQGPKISYTLAPVDGEVFFSSSGLLFETDINDHKPQVFKFNDLHVFYKSPNGSVLPFDPFAAAFYMVSRYEEYLNFIPDDHGRYPAANSIASLNNFLHKPVVNYYGHEIKKVLKQHFPQLSFIEKKFQFISTVDIDNAYAYIGKGWYRTLGALTRSVLKFDFEDLKKRTKALRAKHPDPYDTYDYYFRLQQRYQFSSIFFFLLGDFTLHDKNLPHTSKEFQSLIKSIAATNEIGLHPSYSSNNKPSQLKKEVERLKNISGRPIIRSRQHFLKMSLPHTYRSLIANGITEDYTMGYADNAGFRAGISSPFYFFDLEKNEKTNLKLFPFAVMDATLNNYLHLNPSGAIAVTRNLIDGVKAVNGTFISLWHNETLSETGIWKEWRQVFEFMVEYCSTLKI